MKRREFIALLGGAVVAWPLAALAQQPEQMRRIGVLMGFAESDPGRQRASRRSGRAWSASVGRRATTFGSTLAGRPAIRPRASTMPRNSSVQARPAARGKHATTAALQDQTRIIPIVFLQTGDPVGSGFVASFARPGGNLTGFTNFAPRMGGKWLDLLKEIAPPLVRVAFLFNPQSACRTILGCARSRRAVRYVQFETAAVANASELESGGGRLAR